MTFQINGNTAAQRADLAIAPGLGRSCSITTNPAFVYCLCLASRLYFSRFGRFCFIATQRR
jgi:hypothetical protein